MEITGSGCISYHYRTFFSHWNARKSGNRRRRYREGYGYSKITGDYESGGDGNRAEETRGPGREDRKAEESVEERAKGKKLWECGWREGGETCNM